MTKISMAQAAKLFAVSRPTILKHLQQGKITGEKVKVDKNTFWQIDMAELIRVYPKRGDATPQEHDDITKGYPHAAPELQAEIKLLEAKLEAAEKLAEERGQHIDDLRRMLPGPQDAPARRRWWPF